VEDFFIDMGISALLRVLQDKKKVDRWIRAIAKVYDSIHRAAQSYPPLAAAIDKKQAEHA